MTLPARTESFAAPCQHCHAAEAETPTGCCLPCALEIAHDAHDRALVQHALLGGSYDTRPVFIHPARQLSGAELEDGIRRLKAWHRFLAATPEARPAIPSLYGGEPHDARGGTGASQGGSEQQTDTVCETRDAVSTSEYPVSATPAAVPR